MADYTKVVELPSYIPVEIDQAQLRNSFMAPKINSNLEVAGRLESSDGKSYFDLNDGRMLITDDDGVPVVLIGKF